MILTKLIKFVPAQIKVIEHIRLKYSCRTCEQSATRTTLKIAPVPTGPISKSIATPSLLSQIITSKYPFSLPLYRQEMFFKQHGIEINRKTMSEWMIKYATLFKPIIDILHKHLLQQSVVQADETALKVVKEDKSTCYMWLYCSGTDSVRESNLKNIVLYDYQNSYSGRCAVNYLQGFTGALQVDGYKGYEQTNAQLSGCWAHTRRKFTDAQKAQGNNKADKADKALWAINHIQKLYRIEKLIEGKSAEEKVAIRREQALPLLEQFRTWLDRWALQVPPKSAVGKTIAYNLNQWQKLVRYVENGDLNIDNNRAERAIKPFVIGRKNWLFSNSASGSAVLYSVIETEKANGLTPFNYLMHLLEELPKEPDDLEPLLPWNVELEQKI
jgi:transposase